MLDEVDFLRRGLIRGVDGKGAGELVEGGGDVSALLEDAATIDVGDTGEEAHTLVAGLIAEVGGGFQGGLTIVLVGGVVVLVEFGVLGAVVPGASGLGVGLWTGDGDDARRHEGEQREAPFGEKCFREERRDDSATHAYSVCVLYTVRSEA